MPPSVWNLGHSTPVGPTRYENSLKDIIYILCIRDDLSLKFARAGPTRSKPTPFFHNNLKVYLWIKCHFHIIFNPFRVTEDCGVMFFGVERLNLFALLHAAFALIVFNVIPDIIAFFGSIVFMRIDIIGLWSKIRQNFSFTTCKLLWYIYIFSSEVHYCFHD